MNNLSKLTKQVILSVKRASCIMKAKSFTVDQKDSPSNIVTSADVGVQRFLQQKLCKLLPGSGFFGEEGNSVAAQNEYTWIVDPIDGTANFARGIAECAISVALIRGDEAVLGVVYNPFQKHMFCAEKGKGAFLNGKPIHVSNAAFEEGLLCTALSLYRKDYAEKCTAVISEAYAQCNDIRRLGTCAIELCYLAAGRCDLYFEIRVFPWDYAAAFLILEEAGGVLFGFNGEKLSFDKATPLIGANSMENYIRLNAIVNKHIDKIPYEEILR